MQRVPKGERKWISMRCKAMNQHNIENRYWRYVYPYYGMFVDNFYFPCVYDESGVVKQPYFSTVLFARVFPDIDLLHKWKEIEKDIYYYYVNPGSTDMVTFIPDDQMSAFVESFRHLVEKKINPNLEIGDLVRATKGPYANKQGILKKIRKGYCYIQFEIDDGVDVYDDVRKVYKFAVSDVQIPKNMVVKIA